MSGGIPLVVFGDDWGRHVSSMQHLLRHVIPHHPTVWVNAIGHRTPGLGDARRIWEKLTAGRRPAGDAEPAGPVSTGGKAPDIVLHPRVLPWHHWRPVEAFNRGRLVRTIRAALASLGGERPVIVTGTPPSVGVLGHLNERAVIYFCMDDWAHLPGVSPHMLLPLERRLLDRCDAFVATARALTTTKQPSRGTSHYLPQGVNYEHFATPRAMPADLAALPAPRIGFAGGVGPGLNLPMLEAIAARVPEGSVVLVGPEQPGLGTLHAPNIHRLGRRPYDVLPAYVQGFDVGIMPYVRNPWMDAVDPLKLLEYLAAGIPVVASDLPEVTKYAASVAIAATPAAFADATVAALHRREGADRAARQAVAATHTWTSRAEQFRAIMAEAIRQP